MEYCYNVSKMSLIFSKNVVSLPYVRMTKNTVIKTDTQKSGIVKGVLLNLCGQWYYEEILLTKAGRILNGISRTMKWLSKSCNFK